MRNWRKDRNRSRLSSCGLFRLCPWVRTGKTRMSVLIWKSRGAGPICKICRVIALPGSAEGVGGSLVVGHWRRNDTV